MHRAQGMYRFEGRDVALLHISNPRNMSDSSHAAVTEILERWSGGDRYSLNELLPLVEEELRSIARRHMRRERPGHILQSTALVNEVYLKLVQQTHISWNNRSQFLGIAARIMRQILVDYSRSAGRAKRGGNECHLQLEDDLMLSTARAASIVALDDALQSLAHLDKRKARVVELRYFGGLNVEEVAEVLNVHPNTVIRDWSLAKAWLRKELHAQS